MSQVRMVAGPARFFSTEGGEKVVESVKEDIAEGAENAENAVADGGASEPMVGPKGGKIDPAKACQFSLMFPTLKRVVITKKVKALSKDEIIKSRDMIVKDFGLTKNEMLYVASHKPDMLLYGTRYEKPDVGMRALKTVFLEN